MKVFFTGSHKGSKELSIMTQKIYDVVEKAGYTHLDSEIKDLSYDGFIETMETGRKAYLEHYEKKIAALQMADICIFEVSYPSLGIGFLVEKALKDGKPTIAIYYNNYIPHFLLGVVDDKLILKKYTEKNISKVVIDALNKAREHREKRFNFFISPKLLNYLEGESKKKGITKSMFIRNLLLQHMRNSGNISVD